MPREVMPKEEPQNPARPYPLNLRGDVSPLNLGSGPQKDTAKQGIWDTPPPKFGGESANPKI